MSNIIKFYDHVGDIYEYNGHKYKYSYKTTYTGTEMYVYTIILKTEKNDKQKTPINQETS